MNLARTKSRRTNDAEGSALIAMLAILAIMFIFFTIDGSTLKRLSQQVEALNRQQTNHVAIIHK